MNFTANFMEKQKEIMLKEKERIEARMKVLKKYPDYGGDDEDNLQELADYESNLSLDDQLEFLLKKINTALRAIEDGTYGQCSKCRSGIEHGRLDIMPYAELCVSCNGNAKRKRK